MKARRSLIVCWVCLVIVLDGLVDAMAHGAYLAAGLLALAAHPLLREAIFGRKQ